MSTIHFTSDWHIGHKNIVKHSDRPYKDLDEMHSSLIENYNKKVDVNDTCYFLGDMTLGKGYHEQLNEVMSQLNNSRKILILGNHDMKMQKYLRKWFNQIENYMYLKYNKKRYILFHFPIWSWHGMNRQSRHLHGHSHGTNKDYKYDCYKWDVGVDGNDYTPISVEELEDIFSKVKDPKARPDTDNWRV